MTDEVEEYLGDGATTVPNDFLHPPPEFVTLTWFNAQPPTIGVGQHDTQAVGGGGTLPLFGDGLGTGEFSEQDDRVAAVAVFIGRGEWHERMLSRFEWARKKKNAMTPLTNDPSLRKDVSVNRF